MLRFLVVLVLVTTASTALAQQKKKLIEFGWDEPSTSFMRQHIRQMEQMPFDGVVFEIWSNQPANKRFIDTCWGKDEKFTFEQFSQAVADLKAAKSDKLTENLLRFNITPGDVDFFDDYSAVLSNAAVAARVAKAGGARGILFDVEQYASQLWNYSKKPDAKTKSFEQYAAQGRTRGRAFMDAIQKQYPDVVIMFTFAYSLAYEQAGHDPKKLPQADYALLVPFMDGMIEAARPGQGGVKLVDGYEISYAYRQEVEYQQSVKLMRESVLPFVADPAKYKKIFFPGFGVWMDEDWRKHGWDTKDFSKNYFSPQLFEATVRWALVNSDEYVWIYTEKPWWWSPPDGKPKDLPQQYIDALRQAKESAEAPRGLSP